MKGGDGQNMPPNPEPSPKPSVLTWVSSGLHLFRDVYSNNPLPHYLGKA